MTKTAILTDHVTVHYGKMPAITDVCLSVSEGEYLGIIGPNGGGKSTLLKAILGLVPLSGGTIEIFGEDPRKMGSLIGYVPQISTLDKHFPSTVLEVVLTGRLASGLSPFFRYSKEDFRIVYEVLERIGISELANRQIGELSGGEFQKMLLSRALAVKPRLLLLDEPTASTDAASRAEIYTLLEELHRDMTILLVTHDLFAVSSAVERIACLNDHLVYHGEAELSDPIVTSLYGCPVDLIAHGVPHRVLKEHGEGHR
ncbi:MAG: ABC transporter ATP-binding protein [Eubacteriales bacterium]|nr:ABC transporter ATP-binding protein [Eubacteriales bacterium]